MITANKISATYMANAIQHDLQFHIPIHPRFLKEIAVIPLPEHKFLFEGTEERQVLGGKSTSSLFPLLLPLLDGTKTLEELYRSLPAYSQETLYQAIVLLYARGLLEDVSVDVNIETSQFEQETLNYFRRHVDTTRVHRSGAEAMNKMLQAKVKVFAREEWGIVFKKELEHVGITNVHVQSFEDEICFNDESLVIVFTDGMIVTEKLRQLDTLCAENNIRWLLSEVSDEKGELFYLERGETPCYSCIEKVHKQNQSAKTNKPNHYMAEFWMYFTVQELMYCLSRINPLFSGQYVYQLYFQNWTNKQLRLPFVPGCSCRPIDNYECKEVPLAAAYENSVAFPSFHLNTPKSHQMHYKASNMELAHHFKKMLNFPVVTLPQYDDLPKPDKEVLHSMINERRLQLPNRPLTLAQLAVLVLYGAGIKQFEANGQLKRWSPTGGNLGSTELYLMVHHVESLESGIYFYQPANHSLSFIEALSEEQVAIVIRSSVKTQSMNIPSVLIVAASNVGKVSAKYHFFGYRISCLDAGVSISQMNTTANGLNLYGEVITSWDDHILANRLRLSEKNETVSGGLAVY
ncbi:SagB/ThcOx family dehydrogenase [Brevibacillus laterosporus]|nr:SagB family peptide dehydrogenase [Brevibacillus laterosporus]TPG69260.1 SagB/ThcOx family dehydrogenase [Brevibacillus laterosporus]